MDNILVMGRLNTSCHLDCDADKYASDNHDTVTTDATKITTAFANKMWMFEMDGSDYELTLLDNNYETMSYDNYLTVAANVGLKDGKFSNNTMRVADDAVVFVKTGDEIKVVSGKTVVSWSEITANTTTKVTKAEGLTDKTNGYNYMQVGAIVLNGTNDVPGGSDYSYGYVTAKPSTSKIDSTSYTTLTIWNGEKEITITGKTNDGEMKNAVKGTFVQYSTVNDQYVKVEHVKTVANAIAIEGFDKDGINGKDYADTYTVIGVDTKNITGVAGVVVDEADTTSSSDTYFLNAVTFGEDGGDTGDIAAVFMANNNRIYNVDEKTYDDNTALTSSDVRNSVMETKAMDSATAAELCKGAFAGLDKQIASDVKVGPVKNTAANKYVINLSGSYTKGAAEEYAGFKNTGKTKDKGYIVALSFKAPSATVTALENKGGNTDSDVKSQGGYAYFFVYVENGKSVDMNLQWKASDKAYGEAFTLTIDGTGVVIKDAPATK